MAHTGGERLHAQEELAKAERDRAIEIIAVRMRQHGIPLNELEKRGVVEGQLDRRG